MWYPATITVAASGEPVTRAEAQQACRVDTSETEFDAEIDRLIAAARAHGERYTGIRFASQTVTGKCDSFCDMARLPEAPLTSVSSVAYVDADGAAQTLSTDVYEVRTDGLETAIVLKYGQSWPAIQSGSRITLTAVVGYASPPDDIRHALLMLVAFWFANHEAAVSVGNTSELPFGIDALLINHRRGV